MLEKKIESDAVKGVKKWGEKLGVELSVVKMNPRGNRSWPDRTFLWGEGNTLLVEYKQPGKAPTKLQKDKHEELRRLGFEVLVHDNAEQSIREITARISATIRADRSNEKDNAG